MIQPGTKLGHYEILSAIAKGGMGRGWRAHHELEDSFVFDNTTKVPQQSGGGAEAAALAAKMVDSWVAFARSGYPSTPSLPWPAYTRESRQIMVFNNESGTASDTGVAERHFWATMHTGLKGL